MVGLVLVSHSGKIAEGLKDLTAEIASKPQMAAKPSRTAKDGCVKPHPSYYQNTIDSYKRDMVMFDKFTNKTINSINIELIKDYLKYLKDNNHNERSIVRNISTLRSFYKFLIIQL